MICPRCSRENEDGNRFCGRCGLDFSDVSPSPLAAEGETQYCYRHKRETTNLSCGRCGKPICYKCAMIGPAGPRCPDCGRQKLPLQPRAVAATGKLALMRVFRSGPYTLYIYLLILMMIGGAIRGCMFLGQGRDQAPRSQNFEDSGQEERPARDDLKR